MAKTDADRRRCDAADAADVAQADASIDAGYYATEAEVDAWIDSIGTDHELPVPYPRYTRPI